MRILKIVSLPILPVGSLLINYLFRAGALPIPILKASLPILIASSISIVYPYLFNLLIFIPSTAVLPKKSES